MKIDKNILSKYILLLMVVPSLIFAGCECQPDTLYVYHPPQYINAGFEVGTLEEVNIDSSLIKKAIDNINCGEYGEVHSMLIFKDNKLVLEEYFPGHRYNYFGENHHGDLTNWDVSKLHDIKSVSKSVTSTCIGIAIDKGFIKSIHQSIFDYLPEHQNLKIDGKEKITIEHLLTMTSGLEWNEWKEYLSSKSNDIINIWFQEKDPVSFVLEKALINNPGTSFTYSSGNTIVLGEIIKNATGMELDKFSEEYLFIPLGIDSSYWGERYKNGVIEAGGGLEITPRDMVKIGVMYLNDGVYSGKRILSKQWIENCTTAFANNKNIDIPGHDSGIHSYSYSWWLKTYTNFGKKINMYHGVGWGGQEIIVLPELNTVVVFTGGNYTATVKVIEMLEEYLLPAIN